MKKIFILSILVIMAVFLFGCDKKTLPTTTTTTTSTSTSTTESTTTTTTTSTTTTTAATTGSITGSSVLNDNDDPSGITVTAEGNPDSAAITASDGSFTILNIPGGTYSLRLSKSGYATRTVSGITVQNGATANAGTTPLYREYDLSSLVGSESILSMTQLNGYLCIATNLHLFKVSSDNPTTAVASITVTHNYDSMLAGSMQGGPDEIVDIISALYEGNGTATVDSFDESLTHVISEPVGTSVPGIALYDLTHFYSYNNQQFVKHDFSGGTSGTANVSETGIISLEYGFNNYFYACDPTTYHKYDSSFNRVGGATVEPLGGGTNLIGIAHDGTYIWLLDAGTKKLIKIKDS